MLHRTHARSGLPVCACVCVRVRVCLVCGDARAIKNLQAISSVCRMWAWDALRSTVRPRYMREDKALMFDPTEIRVSPPPTPQRMAQRMAGHLRFCVGGFAANAFGSPGNPRRV